MTITVRLDAPWFDHNARRWRIGTHEMPDSYRKHLPSKAVIVGEEKDKVPRLETIPTDGNTDVTLTGTPNQVPVRTESPPAEQEKPREQLEEPAPVRQSEPRPVVAPDPVAPPKVPEPIVESPKKGSGIKL